MMPRLDIRRGEVSRLKRAIAYHCGVIVRSASRQRIHDAHAAIRRCEQQLRERSMTASKTGGGDE
jgi:hypothetical protein